MLFTFDFEFIDYLVSQNRDILLRLTSQTSRQFLYFPNEETANSAGTDFE